MFIITLDSPIGKRVFMGCDSNNVCLYAPITSRYRKTFFRLTDAEHWLNIIEVLTIDKNIGKHSIEQIQ